MLLPMWRGVRDLRIPGRGGVTCRQGTPFVTKAMRPGVFLSVVEFTPGDTRPRESAWVMEAIWKRKGPVHCTGVSQAVLALRAPLKLEWRSDRVAAGSLQPLAVALEDADARVQRGAAMIPRPRTLVIRRIWPGSQSGTATMEDGSP